MIGFEASLRIDWIFSVVPAATIPAPMGISAL